MDRNNKRWKIIGAMGAYVVLKDGIEILTDRDFQTLRFVLIDYLAIQKIKKFFQWEKQVC